MTISAKGQTGTLTFDGQFVTITRKGLSAQGRGEKRIPVRSIQAVQLKTAGTLGQGFIGFTVSGGTEVRSRIGSQVKDAWKDENSVVFLKKSNDDFVAIRDAVEAAITGSTPVPAATPQADAANQIAKLAALHAQGILSDDEFAAAKAKALGV